MCFCSEERITCLNQTLPLMNINGPCQCQVEWTPFATGWIQISSTFTLLKLWTESNLRGKPPNVTKRKKNKKNYFSLLLLPHIVFSDSSCVLVAVCCYLLCQLDVSSWQIFGDNYSRPQWNVGWPHTLHCIVMCQGWTTYQEHLHFTDKCKAI